MDTTNNSSSPLSFFSWLETKNTIYTNLDDTLLLYQNYLIDWKIKKDNGKVDRENYITDLYVDLIKELSINFTSEEEKRFIANFDYTIKENLDIIIPFFIRKLKSVCLYYSLQREKIKEKIALLPYKGTNLSVSKVIKNLLISNIETGSSQKILEGKTTLPSLSAINLFLDVKIEELYDTENYFDEDFIANDLSSLSTEPVEINSDLYINFQKAIKSAIDQYPVFLETLFGAFSLNVSLTGGLSSSLKERDFINYLKSDNEQDLKIDLFKNLAPRYSSCSFYYLSTGNTSTDIVSGVLFNPGNNSKDITQNLLNKSEIRVAQFQNLNSLYTSYELGKFFEPSKLGVLKFDAIKSEVEINYKNLTPNTTYVFPDPKIVEGDTKSLTFKVDVSWNKIGRQDGFRFGDVITGNHLHRFYPYTSYSQKYGRQPVGISISTESNNFWSEDNKKDWIVNNLQEFEGKSDSNNLLLDTGIMTEWYVDLYENQISLYKILPENCSVFDKHKLYGGKIFVKETTTGKVGPFKEFFESLYYKYPDKIVNELDGDIFSIYCINNTLVIETSSYVLIDSYVYDVETTQFKNTTLPGIYVPKFTVNEKLEKYVNSFYVEEDRKLYVCFLKLIPSLSASNYKSIYPVIYTVDADSNKIEQIYPTQSFNASFYSLSSSEFNNYPEIDLRRIEGGKFSYKKKYGVFNLTYYAYNNNNIPFIVNEQFSKSPGLGTIYSYQPILQKPYYYVRDTNFANPDFDMSLRHSSNYSGQVGYKDLEVFKYTLDKNYFDKFHFCSNIKPVYINVPGRHYVQFDWDSYVFGNVYVGCESIGVAKVDLDNVIDLRDGSPAIIMSREEVFYKVKDYNLNNKVYTLSAIRPLNSNQSLINFVISLSNGSYEDDIFCKDLNNTYKKVSVVLRGNGEGIVTGEPSCLNCGDLCEFYYPKFSSITIIPSAAPDNAFVGWLGSQCQGFANTCTINVTDTTTVTAIFNKIPEYSLKVTSNIPGVIPRIIGAKKVDCNTASCSAIFKQNEVALLSADVIPGYYLSNFKNTTCTNTYDCTIPMTNNLSVTAIYLSSVNTIEIFNTKLNNNLVGTLYCSLSPQLIIDTYEKFTVPSNTTVVLSANLAPGYVFYNFAGSPCFNLLGNNFCSFNVTKNYSVTAFYDLPRFSVSVLLSGNGLYTVSSNTSPNTNQKIDAGTRSLQNTKKTTNAIFLSGESVTLNMNAVQIDLDSNTEITLFQAPGINSTGNTSSRQLVLPGLTNNVVVTAAAIVDPFDFFIYKVGSSRAINHTVSIKINNEPEEILSAGTAFKKIRCIPGDRISLKQNTLSNPIGQPAEKLLYFIGSSDINEFIEVDSYFKISDGIDEKTTQLNVTDKLFTITEGAPLYFSSSEYSLPVYTPTNTTNPLKLNNVEVIFVPMSDNQSISAVFG